jgi:DNA replication protein DnaC
MNLNNCNLAVNLSNIKTHSNNDIFINPSSFSAVHQAMDFSTLEENYANVEKYIQGICKGEYRSVIVNGPPGVGKSFSVDAYLQQYAQEDTYKVVAGHMTPLSLYGNLYHYRHAGDVLVLDDIDSVFSKIEGINLLKAAMDTKPLRRINWESTSSTIVNLGSSFIYIPVQ